VAVRGHVISCDHCEVLMGMPTPMKHADAQSREEMVRVYAVGWGWRRTEDGDRCPYHEVEQGRFAGRLARLRDKFSGAVPERSQQRTDPISPRIDDHPVGVIPPMAT
jgi:hypothetical protein